MISQIIPPEEIAQCRACSLGGGPGLAGEHYKPLPNGTTRLMVVAESPCPEGLRKGRPFMGITGNLFRGWLDSSGWTGVYLTNILKHPSPSPTKAQMQACEPWLLRELAAVKPHFILLLGWVACSLVAKPNEKMSDLHGHMRGYQGYPVMMMYHPSYVAKNPHLALTCVGILILLEKRIT